MTKFYVRHVLSNARDVIGYQVMSKSIGGERSHFSRTASEPVGLAKAKAACDAEAARLQVEADGNRQRSRA